MYADRISIASAAAASHITARSRAARGNGYLGDDLGVRAGIIPLPSLRAAPRFLSASLVLVAAACAGHTRPQGVAGQRAPVLTRGREAEGAAAAGNG